MSTLLILKMTLRDVLRIKKRSYQEHKDAVEYEKRLRKRIKQIEEAGD